MILQPKSRFGQQFLELYGNEWVLIRKMDSWHSSKRPGPYGFVQQVEGLKTFFIHLVDDPHFLIQRK
jgi:aromatic ring-opening dioxygenase LigB subunit